MNFAASSSPGGDPAIVHHVQGHAHNHSHPHQSFFGGHQNHSALGHTVGGGQGQGGGHGNGNDSNLLSQLFNSAQQRQQQQQQQQQQQPQNSQQQQQQQQQQGGPPGVNGFMMNGHHGGPGGNSGPGGAGNATTTATQLMSRLGLNGLSQHSPMGPPQSGPGGMMMTNGHGGPHQGLMGMSLSSSTSGNAATLANGPTGGAGTVGAGLGTSGFENSMLWQQQVMRAEASRQAAAPHHRARASALASRMVHLKNSIPILDPNKPSTIANVSSPANGHRKAGSLMSTGGASGTADDAISVDTTSSPTPAPMAPSSGAREDPSEPWTGLDLGGIRLKTLNESIYAYTHITALYINHNQLTTLSPSIANLKRLTHLDATGNQLVTVPPQLGQVTTLKELLLFDNAITNLPMELGTLYNLEFLGIEGNPINEAVRHLIAEKGTQGLITYYRDNCTVPAPPQPRKWEVIEEDIDESDTSKESVSVFSWNVLFERYATSQMYGYTPSWALEWSYRKDLIMNEIQQANADVICLQECGDHVFHDFFYPRLAELGYDGVFHSKTRARTMTREERKNVDGCATFWKKDKYTLVLSDVVEYNRIAINRADLRTADTYNRVGARDDIANICLLEDRRTFSRLVVAGSHLVWDPALRDVKLVQTAILIEQVVALANEFARYPPKRNVPPLTEEQRQAGVREVPVYPEIQSLPIVICGDFNSAPGSPVYKYLSEGNLPAGHEDFLSREYGAYTSAGINHPLQLRSSYAPIGELPWTNYGSQGFQDCLDYIWFSRSAMSVTGVLGEIDRQYIKRAGVVGLPNAHLPSDHIPLSASFRFKQPRTVIVNVDPSVSVSEVPPNSQ